MTAIATRTIRDDVDNMLRDAGTAADVARAQAALVAASFESFGRQTGIDPAKLFYRYGLSILPADGTDADAAFDRWFAGSRIVDDNGQPQVCYHGTPSRAEFSNNRHVRTEQAGTEYPMFEEFRTEGGGITDGGWLGEGAYFTPEPDYAEEFGDVLMPVYLAIKHPFVVVDDHSTSVTNRFRFLMSLQNLPGLPDEFKLDLSLDPVQIRKDYTGAETTWYYSIREAESEDGTKEYVLLSGLRPEGCIVEGTGETPEEAIFAYRYRYEHSFHGFLLHIVGRIGAERLTRMLKDAGFDGVISQDTSGRVSDVLAYYPEQIKSAVGNRGTFSSHEHSILKQDARGAIAFDASRTWFDVSLSQSADASTFIHESAHLYLEVMDDLVTRGEAGDLLSADMAIARAWLGVAPGEAFTEEHHEQWARGVEAYLLEREAVVGDMAPVFGRVKSWLQGIYSSVSHLNVELNDSIRGVFDRLFGAEQLPANASAGTRPDPARSPGLS